jgi:hypothetical protein
MPTTTSLATTRASLPPLGRGIGWRRQLALFIERRAAANLLNFIELVHEDFPTSLPLPPAITSLLERGLRAIPHGLTLNLGGAERPSRPRLRELATQAKRLGAPLVSEHIAFVRAGGTEAGHLLPVPRTRAALAVVVENVKEAQGELGVPLAIENIASLLADPSAEMSEAVFVAEVIHQTGALLLLDLENIYANSLNHAFDARGLIDALPLHALAYCHVAGGAPHAGFYHDTHTATTPQGVLDLLTHLAAHAPIPGVMLERDGDFDVPPEALSAELDAISAAWDAGRDRRAATIPPAHALHTGATA